MTPDGTLQSIPNPSGRIDRALGMLRAHLLERTAQDDWHERHAHEITHAIVTCLRESTDVAADDRPARAPGLSRECLRRGPRSEPRRSEKRPKPKS